VRAASFSSGRINPGEHHAWLESRLADRDTLLLVAMEGPDLAGQVRFDIQGDSAVVSISLATDYRGLGISGPVLHRATTALEAAQPGVRVLVARVKPDNAASRRLFEEAGFSQTGPDAATPGGALELRRRLEAG
jgi:RimJ/RimL family protein N-acetyltransferase